MKYALLNVNSLVVGTNDSPASGYVECPNEVECGWQLDGETWEKSAALIAQEATALDRATKRTNVANAVATLRQWSTDAATAVTAWDGQTQTQKNNTVKTVIDRLGTFMSRFADLIEGHHS